MIKDPTLQGKWLFKTLDTRVKLLSFLCLAVPISLSRCITVPFLALLPAIFLLWQSGFGMFKASKRLFVANSFLLALWPILPFVHGTTVLFKIGPLNLYLEGVGLSLLITVKSNVVLILIVAFLGTTSPVELGHALTSLKVPRKLTALFLITHRYISVIEREYKKLEKSLKARSFVPKNSLATYSTVSFLVGMLLVRAYERSQRVQMAMEARGFSGTYHSLYEFNVTYKDVIFFVGSLSLSLLLGFIEWMATRY